jgi:hypothetical protein
LNIQKLLTAALVLTLWPSSVSAQSSWEIVDNSFLIEEAFNQERGVFQNIVTWTRARDGSWQTMFVQEWPAPGIRHQVSYSVPFSSVDGAEGFSDALLNYRYQLLHESRRQPALAPRASLVLPTGRKENGLGSGRMGLELNLPASKHFGNVYVHGNAGLRWLPDVSRQTFVGASGIWQTTPMFNLILEAIGELHGAFTISPGFRRGWNIGERQIVVGLAVPLVRRNGSTDSSLLTYFSYELPFH